MSHPFVCFAASSKKENEELIKERNIVGVFVDIASDMYTESGEDHGELRQATLVDLPSSFHDHDEL
jgi:hypothetical protein